MPVGTPTLWKLPFYFVSMDLSFWTFHINGIVEYTFGLLYLAFFFLRFIYVIACISISFLFVAKIVFSCTDMSYFVYLFTS